MWERAGLWGRQRGGEGPWPSAVGSMLSRKETWQVRTAGRLGLVEDRDRRAAERLGPSLKTQVTRLGKSRDHHVVCGTDLGIDHWGGREGHGKDREEKVITPGSGQDRATHSQSDTWLTGQVPGSSQTPGLEPRRV